MTLSLHDQLAELRLVASERADQIANLEANPKSVKEVIGVKKIRLITLREAVKSFERFVAGVIVERAE